MMIELFDYKIYLIKINNRIANTGRGRSVCVYVLQLNLINIRHSIIRYSVLCMVQFQFNSTRQFKCVFSSNDLFEIGFCPWVRSLDRVIFEAYEKRGEFDRRPMLSI